MLQIFMFKKVEGKTNQF